MVLSIAQTPTYAVFGAVCRFADATVHLDVDRGALGLWGTPILAGTEAAVARGNAQLGAYMEMLADTEPMEERSNRNGAWQSLNKRFLDPQSHASTSGVRKVLRKLQVHVRNQIARYLRDLLSENGSRDDFLDFEVTLDASWANVNPPGGINGPHVHPYSAISGAYYVACGGNASAEVPCTIALMDPRPSAPMSALPSEVRNALDFGIDWNLSLWPGTLLIFPSWLTHWVPPNPAAGRRLTISFNAGIKLIANATKSETA